MFVTSLFIALCLSSFSCSSKIPQPKQHTGEKFLLAHSVKFNPSWWKPRCWSLSGCSHSSSQEREQMNVLVSAQLALFLSSPNSSAHGMVLPIFKKVLPISVNVIKFILHKPCSEAFSQVCLDSVKFIVTSHTLF